MRDPIIVFMATIRTRPETADQVAEALTQVGVVTSAEPGCLSYQVHRSTEDPTLLVTVEEWKTPEDNHHHFEMPYVKDLVAQALLAAEPVFRSCTRL